MKQHELTDEQIEWGKSNRVQWCFLTQDERDVLQGVQRSDLEFFGTNIREWQPCLLVNKNHPYNPSIVYRIRPDYQRPEPPEVEKWIVCDVVKRCHEWKFENPFNKKGTMMRLSRAVDIVGFGGVHFKGATGSSEWVLFLAGYIRKDGYMFSRSCSARKLATPLKVRFLNPEWKGGE